MDLGGTWLRWGGAQPGRLRLPNPEPEAVVELLAERTSAGVAISFAGWLSADRRRVVQGPNLGWQDVPLSQLFADRGLGCHLENDLDARVWGEFLAMDGPRDQSLLAINGGSGFALGLVVEGRLIRGARSRAGELGHLVMGPQDQRCGCGDLGCSEALLGGAHHSPQTFDDPAFQQRWVDLAARVVAPVVTALDPHRVILVGGILESRPELASALESAIGDLLPRRWFSDFVLAQGRGEETALVGVADLAATTALEP